MLIPNYGHKCFFLGLHKLWLIIIAISLWGTLCVGDLGVCFMYLWFSMYHWVGLLIIMLTDYTFLPLITVNTY